jgi:hypothetical protein
MHPMTSKIKGRTIGHDLGIGSTTNMAIGLQYNNLKTRLAKRSGSSKACRASANDNNIGCRTHKFLETSWLTLMGPDYASSRAFVVQGSGFYETRLPACTTIDGSLVPIG